ncbi:MAG: folate-binding protein [Polaromonas sp.]
MTTPPTYPAALSVSGVAELSHLGVIRAVGADAATFLQGQLTQDVVSMGFDNARLAAFCNAKGRMQASFVVFKRQNDDAGHEFLMVCSADILAQTLKRLSMFVMRAKVKLSDASADFRLFGVAGDAIHTGAACARIHWSKHDFEGQNKVFLYPGAGFERVLCCVPAGVPPPTGVKLPLETWNWLEVQSGIAMISQPIFEAFVPQMLNYESVGGVNFKKGCYPGQEVVARSQFRGTLKRRAYIAHAAGEMAIGQDVFHSSDAEQPCGLVAACAANPSGGFDAILSMQTSAASSGVLTLGSSSGARLNLQPLPYPLLDDI